MAHSRLAAARPDPARGTPDWAALSLCRPLSHAQLTGALPDWLILAPAGETEGRDGRRFVLRNADAVVARFQADGADIPVDYEHATHIRAPLGLEAPAAGWIVEMQARDGALWARVEWTDDGAAQLRARSYRYYSPAFLLDESGGIVGVPSVGLTNRPNLRVPALHRDGADTDPASIPGDPSAMPIPAALCTALGLPETATEPEACAAVDALKADRATALHRAQTPDLALYVPRADYDAVLHRLREQEAQAAAAAAAELSRQIEDLITQGLTAARITPATVDYHRAAAAAPGGLERLQAFVNAAPAVLTPETRTGQPPAGTPALNADARAIMAAFGNTPETLARYEVTA